MRTAIIPRFTEWSGQVHHAGEHTVITFRHDCVSREISPVFAGRGCQYQSATEVQLAILLLSPAVCLIRLLLMLAQDSSAQPLFRGSVRIWTLSVHIFLLVGMLIPLVMSRLVSLLSVQSVMKRVATFGARCVVPAIALLDRLHFDVLATVLVALCVASRATGKQAERGAMLLTILVYLLVRLPVCRLVACSPALIPAFLSLSSLLVSVASLARSLDFSLDDFLNGLTLPVYYLPSYAIRQDPIRSASTDRHTIIREAVCAWPYRRM